MICLAKNHERCDMNIRSRLSVYCQRNNLTIKTQTKQVKNDFCAEIFINEKYFCEYKASSSWLAKQLASELAYKIICNI